MPTSVNHKSEPKTATKPVIIYNFPNVKIIRESPAINHCTKRYTNNYRRHCIAGLPLVLVGSLNRSRSGSVVDCTLSGLLVSVAEVTL